MTAQSLAIAATPLFVLAIGVLTISVTLQKISSEFHGVELL